MIHFCSDEAAALLAAFPALAIAWRWLQRKLFGRHRTKVGKSP